MLSKLFLIQEKSKKNLIYRTINKSLIIISKNAQLKKDIEHQTSYKSEA
jgi:hypothetical protein